MSLTLETATPTTLPVGLQIRPFTPSDEEYAAVVAVHNAAMPGYVDTAHDWRHWDQNTPAHCVKVRLVAELDGRIVAVGQIFHAVWAYHPRKFHVDLYVHPEQQGQGIGGRLYDLLLERIAAYDPLTLRAGAREDHAAATGFVTHRGFVEEMRFWESRLDVRAFDMAPYAGFRAKGLDQGITIVTLREFLASDPEALPKIYEARNAMMADVPSTEPFTPTPYENWLESMQTDKNLMPDGYFLAVHAGQVVALSQLWGTGEADVLNTGLTATRREYRRLGLALELKLRAVAYAKAHGYREIRTGNESNNRAMLSINERLGFVKQPAWVEYARELG